LRSKDLKLKGLTLAFISSSSLYSMSFILFLYFFLYGHVEKRLNGKILPSFLWSCFHFFYLHSSPLSTWTCLNLYAVWNRKTNLMLSGWQRTQI
jgi:hypothetical protein